MLNHMYILMMVLQSQYGEVHDGHNGTPNISNEILKWLHDNGWCTELKRYMKWRI